MNGWDRDPRYEPDIGWGGRLMLAGLVILFLFGAFGWVLD